MVEDANESGQPRPSVGERRDPDWWEMRYLSGDIPWNTGITPPEVVALVRSGRVERGWALDLGCGTGVTSRYLAGNGFRVIGLDLSLFALTCGSRMAKEAHLPCHFLRASVEDLSFLKVDVTLAVDVGCFHSLPAAARSSYVRTLADRVVQGGYYLLYTFVSYAGDKNSDEATGPSIALPDVAGFAPWFLLRSASHGDDRGRESVWFLMQRAWSAGL